jgi:N-acetylated-alpha-linked acidic dipeptidase
MAAYGPNFSGGATPALGDFLLDTTRSVSHPDVAGSLYDAWAARFEAGTPEVQTIVGATDYTAFQENIGMSCIDLTSYGPYGVYHSQYDNYYWLSRIGDPGFRVNATMSRFVGVLLWRLANVDILSMRYSAYAQKIIEHIEEIEKKASPQRDINLDAARTAAQKWETAALAFERRLDQVLKSDEPMAGESVQPLNQLLLQVERAMTEEAGLGTRPYYKHLIYAPQPTYRPEVLPRIFEAIEGGKWSDISRFESELVSAFDRAAELLNQARALL